MRLILFRVGIVRPQDRGRAPRLGLLAARAALLQQGNLQAVLDKKWKPPLEPGLHLAGPDGEIRVMG